MTESGHGGCPLAIVIPAFKAEYLSAALASIAGQTTGGCRVYVGDDASPHDLHAICREWDGTLDLVYHRFEHNLGGRDLVAQWDRCIALSSEPWVWLFGDDDIMEPQCVQVLLGALAEHGSQHDVFHFDVLRIDGDGRTLMEEPVFPDVLSGRAFAAARMQFSLSSYAPDYVFSRRAYRRVGGFPRFPLAWCADDAGWISMAGAAGIRAVRGSRVRWRLSALNVSSQRVGLAGRKLEASVQYLGWLQAYLKAHPATQGDPTDADVLRQSAHWFYPQARRFSVRFWPSHALPAAWALRRLPAHGLWLDLYRMARADMGRLWL